MRNTLAILALSLAVLGCSEKTGNESVDEPSGISTTVPQQAKENAPLPDKGTTAAVASLEEIVVELPGMPSGAKQLEMLLIPGGTFTMGSPENERGRTEREWPPHEVTIVKSFYLGKYEVTQAQWQALMVRDPSHLSGHPNHPVENILWEDCQSYIDKLSDLGLGQFRLPTEAEWEYACRAGTKTRFAFGDALDSVDVCAPDPTLDKQIWWCGNSQPEGAKQVGLRPSNPWGLYDMHGNVWEWCADGWHPPSPIKARVDPLGEDIFSGHVLRGGGWGSDANTCRSASRTSTNIEKRRSDVGWRLVKVVQ